MHSRPQGTNRLLVVDDEPAFGEFITRVATSCGYDVHVTTESHQFLDLLGKVQPTHIVLDLQMPGRDGIELLRDLSSLGSQAKILLTSGLGGKILAAAGRLGADRGLDVAGIITKPIRVADLRHLFEGLRITQDWLNAEELARAIEADEFTLVYQPKVSLPDFKPFGFEALARLHHPVHGIVMPERFIPLAEQAGLIGEITQNVIRAAIRQLALWRDNDLQVAINISALDLKNIGFADDLQRDLEAHDVSPNRLTMELTETAAMDDPLLAMDILTRLRVKGIDLSIDDFGTGFSSLVYLQKLPISEIKIDQSFVRSSHHVHEDYIIVKTVVDLAHNLGLSAIAEGVESPEVLDILCRLGCDRAQGYHFAKAMPPDQAMAWVDERRR